jgi:hypothetical protein
METQFSSYSAPPITVEVKTGVIETSADAVIQSTSGLVVLEAGGTGIFTVPAPATQASITTALLARTAPPAPPPSNASELSFLNADGGAYLVEFPDGNVLTFSGTQGEMATVVLYAGTYNLKSASNPNTTFVQGAISVNPPGPGGIQQPAPVVNASQPV